MALAAAGPVTPGAATPNASGVQVDPSVAIGPVGQRLVAVTDLQNGKMEVWRPTPNPTPAGQSGITWDHATSATPATHPSIAWDGTGVAHVVAESTTSCAAAGGADVPLQTWTYNPATNTLGGDDSIPALNASGRQSWPRIELGSAGSTIAGDPVTVLDEEACTDDPAHQLVAGSHRVVVTWKDSIPWEIASGRKPAVAVLGTQTMPGSPTVNATALEIAYLSEPSGGQQDVMAIRCFIANAPVTGFPLQPMCDSPQIVDNNIVAPDGVALGGHATATAAPSIACDGACHIAWTEAVNGGARARVFISDDGAPYTAPWSPRQQVASAAGSSASQFMPSVTAHDTRVDVVYMDNRSSPAFDAYQTSFDGPARGLDTSLTTGDGYNPAGGVSLGDRTDVAAFGAKGTVYGYFPGQITGDTPAVIETRVDHGTVNPKLNLLSQTRSIGKNTSTNVMSWLGYTDTDGDPVSLIVTDPAHGTVSGNTYTPDATYAGDDSVTVKVLEAGTGGVFQSTTHTVTITNQAPTFVAPEPAIVDEGGTVVVPLQATDPDNGDIVTFSVVQPAPTPFNVAGRVTTDGNSLRLTVPPNVRSTSAVLIWLKASDTTTGEAPQTDQQFISVTIRPNLKTPSIVLNANVVTGQRLTMTSRIDWSDIAGPCIAKGTCHTQRIWNFGDGTVTPPVTDDPSVAHVYARPGNYRGTVTGVVLWGGAAVKTAPRTFNVTVTPDGRLIFKVTPTVKRKGTSRNVSVKVTATQSVGTGPSPVTVTVSLVIKGLKMKPQSFRLRARQSHTFTFHTFSVRPLKTRRATIRVAQSGTLASGVAPTPVTRTIRF